MGGVMANWDPGTNPVISHCTFINNRATKFCGVMRNNVGAKTTITNCLFQGNSAGESTGAIFNYQSNSIFENCNFKNNEAGVVGALSNIESIPIIRNCIFESNVADGRGGIAWPDGGGIHNKENSHPLLENCIFIKNSAGRYGGGFFNLSGSNPIMRNCIFGKNTAGNEGGAIYNKSNGGEITLKNCTISQNSAGNKGGGIFHEFTLPLTLINCIVWGNTAPQGPQIRMGDNTVLKVSYCDIEGGQEDIYVSTGGTIEWGTGNIDEDPYFAAPNIADCHLQSQAGRWDPNDNSWVCDGVTSPCIDAGDPNGLYCDYAAEL